MSGKFRVILSAAAVFFSAAVLLSAQDVLMNSAETINPGNIKLGLFPTVLLGKNGGDSMWGLAGRGGLGILPRIDIEAKAASFKNLQYLGVDAEVWFIKGRDLNISAAAGVHMTDLKKGADSSGIDTTLLISTRPAHRLELYGGFKLAFDSFKKSNRDITLAHLVPGLECRLSDDLDFLAEFGIALNDDSRNYASIGLSLYLLR